MLPIRLHMDLTGCDHTRPISWTVTGWQIEPEQWNAAREAFGPGLEAGVADLDRRVVCLLALSDRLSSRSVELRHVEGGGWETSLQDRRYLGEWLAAEVPSGNPLAFLRATFVVLP